MHHPFLLNRCGDVIYTTGPYQENGHPMAAGRAYDGSLERTAFTLVWGSDNTGSRTLSAASYVNASGMTVESCITFCSTATNTYIYAGIEYARECCE